VRLKLINLTNHSSRHRCDNSYTFTSHQPQQCFRIQQHYVGCCHLANTDKLQRRQVFPRKCTDTNKTLYGRVALTFDQAFNQNQSLIRVNQGSRCSARCPKLRPATSCLQMAEAVSIHCEVWFAEGTGIEASQPSKGTDYDEGGGSLT